MSPRRAVVPVLLLVGAALAGWFWPVAEGGTAPSFDRPQGPVAPPAAHAGVEQAPAAAAPAREAVAVLPDGDETAEGGAELAGRVLDLAERPIADAAVAAMAAVSPDAVGSASTDADGWYRIAFLAPGNYRVRATAAGFAAAVSGALRVQDGDAAPVDTLRLAPGCTLRGIVVGAGDEPIVGAVVRAGGENATSDGAGRFAVPYLPVGPCAVDVRADGRLSWHRDGIDPTRELRVALAAGLALSGSVHDAATGAAVERYAVRAMRLQSLRDAQQGPPPWQLRHRIERLSMGATAGRDAAAIAADERAIAEYGERLAALQNAPPPPFRPASDLGPFAHHAEGRFVLDRLDEGLYLIEVLSPDHVFARTDPVLLQQGTAAPPLRLVVRSGAVLNGTVTAEDGAAIEGTRLQLIRPSTPAADSRLRWLVGPPPPAGDIVATAVSDRAGSFSMPCVLPGEYALLAHHADHCTTSIRATPGADSPPARVVLVARPSLRGKVSGIPAARSGEVTVLALGGASNLRWCRVDELGQYAFERLQPGEYCIRASLGDADVFAANLLRSVFAAGQPPARDVVLAAGERRTFDFALPLPPMGTLQGTALKNGAPAAGSRIALHVPGAARPLTAVADAAGTFTLRDVPAGDCELRITVRAGGTQELWRETIAVAAGVVTTVQPLLSCGGLVGRAVAGDGAQPNELVGDLLLLPDCASLPDDLAAYRRTHRAHQVPVRAGAFRADTLTSGRSLTILRLRNREPAVASVDVVAGATTEVELGAGALRR